VQDEISVKEAAERLKTTPPTVRDLLAGGDLHGRQEPMGGRFRWRVDSESVEAYLVANGPFDGGRHGRPNRMAHLERKLDRLLEVVIRLQSESAESAPNTGDRFGKALAERDDLRARVVGLTESLARLQSVIELQNGADAERTVVVDHLVAAMSASEQADKLRRAAIADLEEALADANRIGHAGELGA
jgi:excisionase family DNA binding protein